MDAVILVGATAVGFALLRPWIGPAILDGIASASEAYGLADVALTTACWCWSMAVLVMSLRRPRPQVRRLWGRPGPAACLAILVSTLNTRADGVPGRPVPLRESWSDLVLAAGSSIHVVAPPVAIAWSILVLGGRWTASAGWIDRLGAESASPSWGPTR